MGCVSSGEKSTPSDETNANNNISTSPKEDLETHNELNTSNNELQNNNINTNNNNNELEEINTNINDNNNNNDPNSLSPQLNDLTTPVFTPKVGPIEPDNTITNEQYDEGKDLVKELEESQFPWTSQEEIMTREHRPSVAVHLYEDDDKNNDTITDKGGENNNNNNHQEPVEISWPNDFLGYARRLSEGILQVIQITDPDLECVICCDDFKITENMAQLNCGHMFHKECVLEWLIDEKSECPYCRMDVRNYAKTGIKKKRKKKN